MSKLIITHDETVTDKEAVMAVYLVIERGRVSKNKHGKHYCWATIWPNGIRVSVRAKRHLDAADSFHVRKWSKVEEAQWTE